MQMHACNLSRRLTSVPYCKGEGWGAKWSWDNQLSFLIYTFNHLSVFLKKRHWWVFCDLVSSWSGSSEQKPVGLNTEEPLATSCSFLTSPKEAPNAQQRIKQLNGHNPKGVQKLAGLLQRHHIAWNNKVLLLKNPNDIFILWQLKW